MNLGRSVIVFGCFVLGGFASAETIFVPDSSNGLIFKFDSVDGTYDGYAPSLVPSGMTIVDLDQGPDGYLYVLCSNLGTGAGRVHRINPYDGSYQGAVADGFLSYANSIAFSSNTMFICDSVGIKKFDPVDGSYEGMIGAGFTTYGAYDGMAVDQGGVLSVVSRAATPSILRFDSNDGTYKGSYAFGFANTYYSLDIVRDSLGADIAYVVVNDSSGNGQYRSLRFNETDGTYLGALATGFFQSSGAGGSAIDSAGNVYFGTNTTASQWCAMRFVANDGTYKGLLGFGFFTGTRALAAEQPAKICGDVDLSASWFGPYAGMPVTIEIRAVGGAVPLDTQTTVLDASGNYCVNTFLRNGNYDIYCKASHWLKKRKSNVAIGIGGVNGVNFLLTNGDCNNDNFNDFFDYLVLSAAYESVFGDATYNAGADLNGDLAVDFFDYLILSDKYELDGDD